MVRFLSTLLALAATNAQAETVAKEGVPSILTGDYLVQVVGSLFLVILALVVITLVLKRFNTVGASTGGYIQVLASTPLGQRERAVLLQVGADQILVGVASGAVTALHRLSDPVAPTDRETSISFKEVWNFARNNEGGKK